MSLVFALFVSGCAGVHKDFALVSIADNPVSIAARNGNVVRGEVCSYTYAIFFTLNSADTNPKGAVKEAIRKANQLGIPANALANVEIKYRAFAVPLNFYQEICFVAEGNPANIELY